MNENLEKQLYKVLEKSLEIAEQSGQFIIEQAPLLLQEFYRWHLIKNVLLIVFSLISIFLIYKGFKALGKSSKQGMYEYFEMFGLYYDSVSGSIVAILSMIASIFLLIGIFNAIYSIIFIWVAPKLYLIEYFIK